MNFLADEGVDGPIVERLRADGHQVTYVAELEPGIPDDEVLVRANEEGAVLMTLDKDFGDLVYRQRMVHGGVVLARLAGLSAEQKASVVSRAVTEHGAEFAGAFVVIMPMRVRIRKPTDSVTSKASPTQGDENV